MTATTAAVFEGLPDRILPIVFDGVGYTAAATPILRSINLDLTAGRPTILMGPNGCGKTTLLRLAMGLLPPTAGRITFAGHAAAAPGTRAIVFQKPVMLRRTVADNISFALTAAKRSATPADVMRLLDLAHISALAGRSARRLSGGEQQRLALARALAREPHVLFLDEPTASLDPSAAKLVEDIIVRVSASGVKIVMATHALGQARRLAGAIVFMAGGRIVEHTPAADFFDRPASVEARRFIAGDLLV